MNSTNLSVWKRKKKEFFIFHRFLFYIWLINDQETICSIVTNENCFTKVEFMSAFLRSGIIPCLIIWISMLSLFIMFTNNQNEYASLNSKTSNKVEFVLDLKESEISNSNFYYQCQDNDLQNVYWFPMTCRDAFTLLTLKENGTKEQIKCDFFLWIFYT